MYKKLLKQTAHEADEISSRRSFLKSIAYGSLLAISGSSVVHAAARHAKHDVPHKSKPNAVKAKHETAHASKHNIIAKTRHESPSNAKHGHAHETLHARNHDVLHGPRHHLAHESNHHVIHTRKHEIIRAGYDFHHDSTQDIFHNTNFDLVQEPSRFTTSDSTHKTIALHNIYTGDSLKLTYFEQGRYLKDALSEINFLFRDHVSGDIHPVDPALLDQLYDLKHNLGVNKPYHVISGYRSPSTNAQLRRNSEGVAKHSLHMQGRAIDIRIEGYDTRAIRNAALRMRRGGVGFYARSNFVHLDTGSFRTWG